MYEGASVSVFRVMNLSMVICLEGNMLDILIRRTGDCRRNLSEETKNLFLKRNKKHCLMVKKEGKPKKGYQTSQSTPYR